MSKESNRSYEVEAMGGRYRRNSKYLIPLKTPEPMNDLPDDIPDVTKDMPDTRRSGRQAKPQTG